MFLESGEMLGDWVIDRPLGEGGMGTVYLAHHVITTRIQVALKVIKPRDHRSMEGRFVREVEALSTLRHEGIVGIRGWGVDPVQGMFFLAMDFLEGEELAYLMDRGPISTKRAVTIIQQVAYALVYAHERRIFHRDIKPTNIFLCKDKRAVILDFGLAIEDGAERLTLGRIVGTTAYLPPEVLFAEPLDFGVWDVYSTGLVLYEMLTGAKVFRGYELKGGAAMIRQITTDKQNAGPMDPGPHFPTDLREIIRKATHPDQGKRLGSMRDFAGMLVELSLSDYVQALPEDSDDYTKVTMEIDSNSEELDRLIGDWTAILHSIEVEVPTSEVDIPTVTQHPRLIYHATNDMERIVPLSGDNLAIGRAHDNDIIIPIDTAMSRRHLVLRREGEHFVLVDKGSSNGTTLNGRRIHLAPLRHGDIFQAGQTCFMFMAE